VDRYHHVVLTMRFKLTVGYYGSALETLVDALYKCIHIELN